MKRTQHFLLSALFLFLLACLARPSLAQEGLKLTTWDVEVWPEYDKPAVLVLYHGALAEGTSFPQTLRVPLPAGVTVNAVADVDAEGGLFTVPWRSETTEKGQTVVFDLERPNFVVEFYTDVLSPPPSQNFELSLSAPYDAQDGSLSLRQPSRASEMQLNPAMTQSGTDSLGNPVYSQQLGPLVAGQEIPLSVRYTKPDAQPSVGATNETLDSGQPEQVNPQLETATPAWLLWLVGGLVVVLIGAIVVYLLLQWQQRNDAKSRQARRRESRERGTPPVRKSSSVSGKNGWLNAYCPKCGRQYDDDDKFCRSCGTPRQ